MNGEQTSEVSKKKTEDYISPGLKQPLRHRARVEEEKYNIHIHRAGVYE